MNIVKGLPPNIKKIREKFSPGPGTVFTYGDTIYSENGECPSWVVCHEEVHEIQQGEDPEGWWKKWIRNPGFRLDQELEAYRWQYKWVCDRQRDRNKRAKFLASIAGDLAGPLYGNIITLENAKKAIKK